MSNRDEARLERLVLLAIGQDPNVSLYKNEVGGGFYGLVYRMIKTQLKPWPEARDKALTILQRHRVRYGLGTGSPDLVGHAHGRFVGLELKTEDGRVSEEQEDWHEAARNKGATIVVVRSVEDALEVVK